VACAKLRINPGDASLNSLLQAMARLAMLEAADAQELSNTLWAVCELRQRYRWQPQVEQRVWQRLLGEQQLKRIAHYNRPQALADVLLALAHLSSPAVTAPAVPKNFAQDCAVQLLQGKLAQQFTPWNAQEVSNAMWACAKLQVFDTGFVDRAAETAPHWLPGSVAANMMQVAYACRMMHRKDVHLMPGVVKRSLVLLQQCGTRGKRDFDKVGLVAVVVTGSPEFPRGYLH
jgi:hypothetical protein